MKQMRDYLDEGNKNKVFTAPYERVVGFRPTGWTYSAQSAPDKRQMNLPCSRPPKPGKNLISTKTSGRYSIHGVPYSEHSSFPVSAPRICCFGDVLLHFLAECALPTCVVQELVDCLRCLKPKKITPTVSVSKSEEQVELLLNAL